MGTKKNRAAHWTQTRHLYTLFPEGQGLINCWWAAGDYPNVRLLASNVDREQRHNLVFSIMSNPQGASKWYTIGLEYNHLSIYADIHLETLDNLTPEAVSDWSYHTGAAPRLDPNLVAGLLLAMRALIIFDEDALNIAMQAMHRGKVFMEGTYKVIPILHDDSSYADNAQKEYPYEPTN